LAAASADARARATDRNRTAIASGTDSADGRPPRGSGGRPSLAVLKDAGKRYVDDDLGDYAAALTYFGLMSLFPALLVGVALLGLLGQQSTVDDVARYLTNHGAPEATVEAVRSSVQTAVNSRAGASTLLLIVGLAVALYSASGWFAAAGRALNIVHCEDEDRGFVRRKATQLASTVVLIVLSVVLLIAVFLGGGVARELFDVIGLGRTAGAVWTWVRWPLALVVAMALVSYVYSVAPDRRRPFRLITPGAVLAVVIWLLASGAFFFYVSNFSSYNAIYGAFAGVVILLLWLYLTNVALLLGAVVNEVLEGRAKSSPAPTSTTPPGPDRSRTGSDAAPR
jgi:membrane protein